MVSPRLSEDVIGESVESEVAVPEMMFADGEEPVGVRVLTYQSSRSINSILNALKVEEIEALRETSFGKIVEIAEKPAFSGRFAHFLLSRQLKVEKKHEAWFRFVGNPIRFSLREFAIVTGLPCGEFPKKQNLKRKKNIKEKPYWPELFGSVEEMRVSKAIKMLSRRTVKDPQIRLKLACLAIVSSVLLSTSLKQKMLKEHADLLIELDEFFSYPWGRLVFDMLMTSIKKRDVISLSQNTIALQGFALALQLVIVEDVPALTEVVQEACSSSESESDEDENDCPVIKTKKKTLSPAYAREIDRKTEVLVRNIIPQDPEWPVDESCCVWVDEVVDVKVENLVKLIMSNYVFSKDMFKGGLTKGDVEKMRGQSKAAVKKPHGKAPITSRETLDEGKILSVVLSILKPEIQRLDGKVDSVIASVKEVSKAASQRQTSIVASVEAMLAAFKTELIDSLVRNGHFDQNGQNAPNMAPFNGNGAMPAAATSANAGGDKNDAAIRNVLHNISDYSTPPRNRNPALFVSDGRVGENNENFEAASPKMVPDDDVSIQQQDPRSGDCEKDDERIGGSFPKGSDGRSHCQRSLNMSSFGVDARISDCEDPSSKHADAPSFSLGLTQELNSQKKVAEDDMVAIPKDGVGDINDGIVACRQSKRQKTVPKVLLSDYQCGTSIINRARGGRLGPVNDYDMSVIREKYCRLSTLLKKSWVIKLGALSITKKDIIDIADRNRSLPGKVIDIIIHLVRSNYGNQVSGGGGGGEHTASFFDTQFVSSLCRSYPKFKKEKGKAGFSFSSGLVDCVSSSCKAFITATRFYLPVKLMKKRWIGLCLDLSESKIIVLDYIAGTYTESELSKEVQPFSEMLPSLLKQCGVHAASNERPLMLEIVDGVPPNPSPADSGLSACLLMQSHAVSGSEACLSITLSVIPEEAHRAAVMIYEFHVKL